MKTSEIRSAFLKYYERNGHKIMPSSSLVPQNDDTLLFTNAGMVQFKDVFVGLEKRDYKRATTSQKCVRAGGKHNDLEQVGYTARHHTFFEMLGNFSFGDYFKADAINFAWNFITKELGLDKSRLLATVYHTDDEARDIWKKVAGSDFRIIPISTNDNFWAMGDTGPCGPCTEIFYDHGADIFGDVPGSKDEDGDRFVEIWNLVFMQFEQLANGDRISLKAKSIDTGMGLERIAAVMQGKCDNYDIDLFQNLIYSIENMSGVEMTAQNRASYKVIADHLRAVSFLITDGVFPSNEGRGYVLRRILRRAIRHGNLLGIKDPFMHRLVPDLTELMKDAYPELATMQNTIVSTVKLEEEKFISTLDIGLNLLNSELNKIANNGTLNGEVAFKLYDTYGFPLDLTMDIAKERGIKVDSQGFDAAMAEQKNRANWKNSSYNKSDEIVFYNIKDNLKEQKFLGYDKLSDQVLITNIVVEGKEVSHLEAGTHADIVTNKTVFYAECGGQVGDRGIIRKPLGRFIVNDTTKLGGGLIVCHGVLESGKLSVGENVFVVVDEEFRNDVKRHHTATHLLQAALRKNIGCHIAQRGSYVGNEYLRFDFCSPFALTEEQLIGVENTVNEWIMSCYPVQVDIMDKNEALQSGAMALFGEKYDKQVRVVKVVDPNDNTAISQELCGGTHVNNTGEIGTFKILSEASIGSGMRRIEAVAGKAAITAIRNNINILNEVSAMVKSSPDALIEKVKSIIDASKDLEKKNLALLTESAIIQAGTEANYNGVSFRKCLLQNVDSKDLRTVADGLKQKYPDSVCLAVSRTVDNLFATVFVGKSLQKRLSAKELLTAFLAPLNGRGGGNNETAQGGSINVDKYEEACLAVETFIQNLL